MSPYNGPQEEYVRPLSNVFEMFTRASVTFQPWPECESPVFDCLTELVPNFVLSLASAASAQRLSPQTAERAELQNCISYLPPLPLPFPVMKSS